VIGAYEVIRGHGTVTPVIDITEARTHVLDRCPPLAPRDMPFRQAMGMVLAAAVHAAEDVPPFANSAVDGYAVIAASVADAPVEMPVVGEVAAGAHTDRVLGPGEAIRIMTGAPVPAGADAIVMVEDTERLDGGARVRVLRSVERGVAVRAAGDDVRTGTALYPDGTFVTPAVAAVLASVNAAVVSARPRVRVAVLSTGDELVDDGRPLGPGQIRESNRTMLVGLVNDAGCEAVDFGIVRDDEAALEAVLRSAAAECDAIVTSGGVSMGDYDVVKAVLSQIADMAWMQIAIKPAKPFAFGLLESDGRRVPVFGLPGNPVSSLVSFELLARPALRQMAGHPHPARPVVDAIAVDGLPRRPDGKIHFMRVFAEFGVEGRVHVRSVGAQGSHQLAATSLANAIAEVPNGSGVEPGGTVRTHLLWVA
jgi:molybdopterin molybdotransferase